MSRPLEIRCADTGKILPGERAWMISYLNLSYREHAFAETREGAEEVRDFLRLQGAKDVRIYKPLW